MGECIHVKFDIYINHCKYLPSIFLLLIKLGPSDLLHRLIMVSGSEQRINVGHEPFIVIT